MKSPIITLCDVGLTYRKRKSFFRHDYYQALKSVSLEVYRGETLGIVGRNGCGKSTLLRLLAGVFDPDSGSIERNRCTISLLEMSLGFDPELSGRDNIILSAMLLGAPKEEAQSNIDKVIEFSELDEFINEPVKTYSSGMHMRLGFSVAMTIGSDVVLMDESLAAGDFHFRMKAETAISDKARSDQTMVLVSHSGAQIAQLCDRAIWLEDGMVRLQGDAGEVVKRYEEFLTQSKGVGHAAERFSNCLPAVKEAGPERVENIHSKVGCKQIRRAVAPYLARHILHDFVWRVRRRLVFMDHGEAES